MPTFPYFKLPDLPKEHIVKQLDVTDIITLSLASKKSKQAVRNAKIRVGLSWSRDAKVFIRIKPSNGKRRCLSIGTSDADNWNKLLVQYLMLSQPQGPLSRLYWPTPPYLQREIHTVYPFLIVENFEAFMMNLGSRMMLFVKSQSFVEFADIISYHLLDIFHVTEPHSYVTDSQGVPSFISDYQGEFRKFWVHASSVEEATHYLDQLSVRSFKMGTDITISEGFNYDKPLRYKKMVIHDGIWLSIDNLIDMKCVSLDAYNVRNITNQDVITFANHWINGGCPQLSRLYLSCRDGSLKIDSMIFDSLETIPSVHRRRQFPFGTGRDIRRASDGALATLAFENTRKYSIFYIDVSNGEMLRAGDNDVVIRTGDSDESSDSEEEF